MAHLIDFSNNRANMAYVGQKPWHNLGEQLGQDADLDQWRIAAGLDWAAIKRPIFYGIEVNGERKPQTIDNASAILRSDTQAYLGTVSDNRYQIHQPAQVIEFYRAMVESFGFTMETMGCLDGGKRIWGLAKTGHETRVKGQDTIQGYLLLSTSFDGKSATRAKFTSVRVVCWNTLSASLHTSEAKPDISISHARKFNSDQITKQLGIYSNVWHEFEENVNALSDTKLTTDINVEFFKRFLGEETFDAQIQKANKNHVTTMAKIMDLAVNGKGQQFASANNTLWGLVNGVTEYYDHAYTKDKSKRMNSAYFGSGEKQKNKAFEIALDLAQQAA